MDTTLIMNTAVTSQSFSITKQEQQALWDREFIRFMNRSKEELVKLIIGERPI